MELDPSKLTSTERYKLLSGCITPRPIAWVSTRSPNGMDNLAPFSWFNAAGASPMMLTFCVATKNDGGDKDSLRNALPVDEGGAGEFVVNMVVEQQVKQMAASAEALPYGASEFELAGVATGPCHRVNALRVLQSPVSFECYTRQVIRFNPGEPLSGNLVIGEVVHVWLDERIADERLRVHAANLPTVGRMGGRHYTRTRDLFELDRGREALDASLEFSASSPEPS